jgi:hypothetical protein
MLSFFLNKQSQNNPNRQDNSKRSLDNVVENEQLQLLEKQELIRIEGGNSTQNNRLFSDRISLDDFFSGPVPQ